MFNLIEVWRLRWPFQNLNFVIFEPIAGDTGDVFGIVVLLEDNFAHVQLVVSKRFKKLVIEDLSIKLRIHRTIDATRTADAFGCHAAPKHKASTTKLDGAFNM